MMQIGTRDIGRVALRGAALVALWLPLVPVLAQSFDCRKASTVIEHAICKDQTLRQLDSALGDQFSTILHITPERREALLANELSWVMSRDRQCLPRDSQEATPTVACLADAYRTRIQYLASASPEDIADGHNPVSQHRRMDVCAALGTLRGLEDYEISAFAVRCARATPKTRVEVEGDPVGADILIANDFALGANYYRLSALFALAKQLDDTKGLTTQQTDWDTHVRRQCQSEDCLHSAYHDRLALLTAWIQLHSDPLPNHWSGKQEASGCQDDRTDYFRVRFTTVTRAVGGQIEGSAHCGNKVIEDDFNGTKSGNVALVTFEAGFTDETEPAEAALVIRHGHAYWHVLTKIDVEDYTWEAADLILE
ncbi:MAG TPA: lysozyme inhibitor LprI family protein [Steroidobacteraceae bacterium]|nr:lysozyme inhibitor LprI family protein [Steroidobacteraceae bacterium]